MSMLSRIFEAEEEALQEQLDNGEITEQEFNNEISLMLEKSRNILDWS
jgi:uncharacterized membrane protein